jgi:hypothetical protein
MQNSKGVSLQFPDRLAVFSAGGWSGLGWTARRGFPTRGFYRAPPGFGDVVPMWAGPFGDVVEETEFDVEFGDRGPCRRNSRPARADAV